MTKLELQHRLLPILLLLGAATPSCVPNDGGQNQDATSGEEPNDCTPGELGCTCNNDQCFPPYECVADSCVDPNCTPGSEFCQCSEGNLCLGDLECVEGTCMDPEGACVPEDHYRCEQGNVHWFDSCGQLGAVKEECNPDTQNCTNTSDTTAECVTKVIEKCNDGALDPGEDCDLSNFGGETCTSMGFAGGTLACTALCKIDTSNCQSCGNGVIDDGEDCDGATLGPEDCEYYGYDGGQLSCTPNCTYDLSQCTYCDCSSGPCCDGCGFSSASTECDPVAETEYGCPNGSNAGSDVMTRTRAQFCSGFGEGCDGNYGPWSAWQLHDSCSDEEHCEPGSSSCQACNYSFDVTSYECNQFTSANGSGIGGGEIFEICGTTNAQTGHMTITAHKYDNTTFGSRPYQVRVSAANEDPCGPNTWFFVVSNSTPTGIGTSTLTFTFPSVWLPGQTEKAYCVTASTKPGDLGYDGNNPQQQSWWYSDKLTLVRDCN